VVNLGFETSTPTYFNVLSITIVLKLTQNLMDEEHCY